MADGKRQFVASKVATPKVSGVQVMYELDAALSKAVGSRIRVTTMLPGHVLEGTLFTACSITNLIVLHVAPSPTTGFGSPSAARPATYHVIPVSNIRTFDLLPLPALPSSSSEGSLPSIGPVDLDSLKSREESAVRLLCERDSRRGRGIGREAQEIFDALARTLPTRWHGQNIVVNDAVLIQPPYQLNDCDAPKDKVNSLVHVRKVLEGFLTRKKTAAALAQTSNVPASTGTGSGVSSCGGVMRPGVAMPMVPRKGG